MRGNLKRTKKNLIKRKKTDYRREHFLNILESKNLTERTKSKGKEQTQSKKITERTHGFLVYSKRLEIDESNEKITKTD